MPDSIKPHRLALDDRFSVLGFTVRTDTPSKWFEVAIATDPALFRPDAKPKRTAANFYSTRASGPLMAERSESVYLVPTDVLSRFVGQQKLYYALATFPDPGRSKIQLASLPTEVSPYIDIKSFTGRALRRVRGVPSRASMSSAGGYGAGDVRSLEWAGDAAQPGMQTVNRAATPPVQPAPPAPQNGTAQTSATPKAQGLAFDYDDGFDPSLWARPQEAEMESDDHGIQEPIPDEDVMSEQQAYSTPFEASEYSGATFVPAASNNYRHPTSPRNIARIIIHITDGGPRASGTAGWFQNPNQTNSRGNPINVSAHYIVGQAGEIIQCVKHNDVAWHASRANTDSIGIEHCAHTSRGGRTAMPPTETQYCASAALVNWLCQQYGIPMDRQHIVGHAEASPQDNHDCPSAMWDWDYYMGLVTSASCYPRQTAAGQSLAYSAASTRPSLPNSSRESYGRSHAVSGSSGRATAAARQLEVVQLDYTPSNTQDALRLQLDFQTRYQQWIAGVSNTGFFPHSAICQLLRDDGGAGTGFYIARDRILTAAHVVEGANSLTVIPGKNGGTQADGPLGHFSVSSSNWQMHPRYTSNSRDFDLAVIMTSTPPRGQCFSLLEELRESVQSAIIVCGYSAQSSDPAVTATIDPDKQHLDGDYIRTLGAETFQYNLQTLAGASGSPVYYAWGREDEGQQMSVVELHLVGVHVSGFSGTLNQGCRLTDDKIAWINSVGRADSAQAFSTRNGKQQLATRTRAMNAECFSLNWDDVQMIPQPTDVSCWATSAAMIVGWRDKVSLAPETVARIAQRSLARGLNPSDRQQLASDIGLVTEPPQSYSIEGFRGVLENYGPLWVGILTPGGTGHAIVVTGLSSNGAPDGSDTYVRITDPWDRDPGTPDNPGSYLNSHNTGSRYILPWSEFVREYENRVTVNNGTVNVQILHADGNQGRSPRRSGAQGYAMGIGRAPTARPMQAQVIPIAAAIAGATMTRILNNEGDISWELDQLQGLKHIGNNPANAGDAAYATRTLPVAGPRAATVVGLDEIYADCEVTYQYNGRSVGNIQISVVRNSDAIGDGLVVKANIMDDANTYKDQSDNQFAAVKVRFHYTFHTTLQDDHIAITDLTLYGNGTSDLRFRWTQR